MIRGLPTTILSAVLAGAVGIGLFFIKHEVKEQEARLSELNEEVLRNQEVIHVLKAEWSYLNDPARLRALSEKFLSMKVMGASQIATLNSMPVSGVVMAANRPAAPVLAKAEPAKPAAAPVKVAAAAPAPQPPKLVATPPVKPVFVAPSTKIAQSPATQPPAPAPARTIVIQSPALASTPALPGEVR
ncbi:MAG: energy transducer TonB [Rhodospirillaceae bacterium]|nr:energy transducer TonB [Rhodospirillales bacterium]